MRIHPSTSPPRHIAFGRFRCPYRPKSRCYGARSVSWEASTRHSTRIFPLRALSGTCRSRISSISCRFSAISGLSEDGPCRLGCEIRDPGVEYDATCRTGGLPLNVPWSNDGDTRKADSGRFVPSRRFTPQPDRFRCLTSRNPVVIGLTACSGRPRRDI